jgi:hypothetical protein
MGQAISTPSKESSQVDINAQIETLEHNASIAGMKAQACKGAARECFRSKQVESAKERYAHFRGYEAQQANLLKAITALHSQRMTLDAAETNAIVLRTLKATTQQKFKHPLIDSAEVDRITDAIHERGDRVDEDTNQLQTIGSSHAFVDDDWDAFISECSSAGPTVVPPAYVEPPPAFPSVPTKDVPTLQVMKGPSLGVNTMERSGVGSHAVL